MKNRKNKARNLLHDHPLLRKGGRHEKTYKAKRRKEKQELRKSWFSLSAYCVLRENHGCTEFIQLSSFIEHIISIVSDYGHPETA
jgi:hypothetical protein